MRPYVEHWLLAHTSIGMLVVIGVAVIAAAFRYLPRPLLELAAVLTRDPQRRLLYLELIRLRRRDAASLKSYLPEPPGPEPPPRKSAERKVLALLGRRKPDA
jgi:hypothetical protein